MVERTESGTFMHNVGSQIASPIALLVLGGLVAILAIIATFLVRKRSVARGDAILLLGPSDAGKTAILSSLAYGQSFPTHTSLQTNETQIVGGSGANIRLVDVPGHPRIRAQFSEHINNARGIVFVVDASTIARNGAVVAEHLHTILHAITELPPSAHAPPVLIHAHKADLVSASASANRQTVAADRVRTVLERELEKRRQTSVGGVGVEGLGDGDASAGVITGGLESSGDGTFRFDKWEGGDISCVGGWVSVSRSEPDFSEKLDEKEGADTGLHALNDWLDGL